MVKKLTLPMVKNAGSRTPPSRSRWKQRTSCSDPLPTLGQSQAPQMSLLVSGQPMGVSLDFPTPPRVHQSRRNRAGSPNHLDNDGPRSNQRMRERMLCDILWFMCALEVQTTNSGTMRTASVLNRYMGQNRECFDCDEGCQRQDQLDPHTAKAQSVSVLEEQVVHSRLKGQEQHPLSVGSYHSSRTTSPPSFSDPFSFYVALSYINSASLTFRAGWPADYLFLGS